MPVLLYLYLAREMLASLFATLLILTGLFFCGKLVPFLNVILQFHIGFADFIRISFYILPKLLWFSIPVASMLGIVLCFSRLATDNEILILKASGITIYKMLPPIVVISSAMAVMTFYTAAYLVPAGTKAMNALLLKLAREKIKESIVAGEFNGGIGKFVLYTEHVDSNTSQMKGLYLADFSKEEMPSIIVAKRGSLNTSHKTITLMLHEGTIHRIHGEISQSIAFQEYEQIMPLEVGEISGASFGRGSMTLPELREEANRAGVREREGALFMAEFHKRLAIPVSCFFLGLIAFPLGLKANTGRSTVGIRYSLFFMTLYYILTGIGEALISRQIFPAEIIWLPSVGIAGLTFFFVRAANNEHITLFNLTFREWLKTKRKISR